MYSQTLGPFKTTYNRVLARWSLSKMNFIVPRGKSSYENVVGLNIKTPFEFFADSAFTLQIPDEIKYSIQEKYLELFNGKKVVGISVNSIVQEKCESLGIDHDGEWVKVIRYLQNRGFFILMIPHSIRQGSKTRHNNDLLAVENISRRIENQENFHVVKELYSSKELRVLVGLSDYYIASRFHSMISCLCTGVPVLVYGWGFQKYREVLEDFHLEEYCFDASEILGESIITGFERIEQNANSIKNLCSRYLPEVRKSSERNHITAWQLSKR
jgi:polysaccharide pyruvyl transferase WcaK-like protein